MFRKALHEKAERYKFFELLKEIKDISQNDKNLFQNIEMTPNMLGSSLADRLELEKLRGPNTQKIDEYTALRPGSGSWAWHILHGGHK